MNEFKLVETDDKKVIQEITDNGFVWQEFDTIESVVDKLNEQEATISMWYKSSKKITRLLEENTKPTTKDRYNRPIYLDIDFETKRCKYENTFICSKCEYYSTYFLDCRLMMGDNQYQKALSLGLIKEVKS